MAPWDFLDTAQRLARYFSGRSSVANDTWDNGRAAAEAWAATLTSNAAEEADLVHVDHLMLEGRGDPGTAWQELILAYDSWREGR